MKKVVISINTSWNIYNFRLGLLNSLRDNGYDVVIVAPHDRYSEKLSSLGFEYHSLKFDNDGVNPFSELVLIYEYYKIFKKIKPDIFLFYTIKPNIYGSIVAKLLDIPVISNISGLGTVFLNDKLYSQVARTLYKLALEYPKKVFFQNKDDCILYIKKDIVKFEQVDLLPGSGIDSAKFKPSIVSNKKENIVFLFVARLIGDKGLREYLEAAKKIKLKYKHVTFQILGNFYLANPTAMREEELSKWTKDGIIEYLGESDDVKIIMQKADCIVLPSYREGLSRVLLEAASLAKPIVTTNVPGCKDVVDDGVNGYLCEVKNSDDLASKIDKMINLKEQERIEMGKKGREKIIKEFDEKIVIDRYLNAIETILKK